MPEPITGKFQMRPDETIMEYAVRVKDRQLLDWEGYATRVPYGYFDKFIELVENLQAIHAVVDRQAEDEGLWFQAETAPEAFLQQELRHLHKIIEDYSV